VEIILGRNWRTLAFRGFAGVLFGCIALAWPHAKLGALVLLFGSYSLVDGLLAALTGRKLGPIAYAWMLPLEGVLGIGVGLLALL